MLCHGTDVTTLVQTVYASLKACMDAYPTLPIAHVYVYLQGEPASAGGGHTHYGVVADTSYGGHEQAVACVNACLPTDLYCVGYDETTYEDAAEAFASLLADLWE